MYRECLIGELKQRQEKNPRYSLRAFARFLGVSPAYLSLVFNGQKKLSSKQAVRFSEILDLSPTASRKFIKSTIHKNASKTLSVLSRRLVSDSELESMGSWEHYAVLGLANLSVNKANPAWIARKLGISHSRALEIYTRLKQMGFIEEKQGSFYQCSNPLDTAPEIPSSVVRKYHAECLNVAAEALRTISVERRHYSTLTMSVDPKKIEKAKQLIEDFKTSMEELLESGTRGEVYNLQIQLYPLTKG
ncbi:MAG: TIGR02147 family protein [Deltaproteobacteria bacterium]|nr:TIGR02147 family protein [Deltaproteobacteria bacterium]